MKTTLILLSSVLLLTAANAQSSASLAADLQTNDAANWSKINAFAIAQRNEINAANAAALAADAADFKAKLAAATADRDEALAKLSALQTQVDSVLSSTLSELQPQLVAAQGALAAELTTGDGPQAAAKRLVVADLQARIDTVQSLITEAGKSDKQKALEAAQAAKDAADKALLDAQAALQNP